MKESIGSTFLYNIIFIYIIIVFGLITATLSYYKGFKVNTHILSSIQKFEGYNSHAREEINNYLTSIGYEVDSEDLGHCPNPKKGFQQVTSNAGDVNHFYCVYYQENDNGAKDGDKKTNDTKKRHIYYNYSVTSYIHVNLPIVGGFKVPITTKGERIYKFSDDQVQNTG